MNQRASDAWGAMWSVVDWARKWQISETQAHNLRKHPKFPPDATVVIGARCVRFRAEHADREHFLCEIDTDGSTLFHDFPSR